MKPGWCLVLALLAIWLSAPAVGPARLAGAAPGEVPLLVEAPWLQARLTDPRLRIIDMSSGRPEYSKGHLPGAKHNEITGFFCRRLYNRLRHIAPFQPRHLLHPRLRRLVRRLG